MNCTHCNFTSDEASQYCGNCGAVLGATQAGCSTVVGITPARAANLQSVGQLSSAPASPPTGPQVVSEQREHTVVVHDASTSMGGDCDGRCSKLDASKRAGGAMVVMKGQIDGEDKVGVVSFNQRATIVLPLMAIAACKASILDAIQSLQVSGGTNINEGLKAARDLFDWTLTDIVRRIILLTDGQGGDPLHTATDLKARGVIIDVIGVGKDPSGVNEKLLRAVASVVDGEVRYRFIKDSQTLVNHYTELAGKTRT